jgi:hypothetical protein
VILGFKVFDFGFMINVFLQIIFVNKGIDEELIQYCFYTVILDFRVYDFGFFDSCALSNLICCYVVILGMLSLWSI